MIKCSEDENEGIPGCSRKHSWLKERSQSRWPRHQSLGSLSPRTHFPIQALEAVNRRLRELYPESEDLFDIVLVTNNHAQVGVRLINSINHYGKHDSFGHDMIPSGHPGLASQLCRVQVCPLES